MGACSVLSSERLGRELYRARQREAARVVQFIQGSPEHEEARDGTSECALWRRLRRPTHA